MAFPKLPTKAAYININNPSKRNALSLKVLRHLRAQLHCHLTSPATGRLLTLPPFKPHMLDNLLSKQAHEHNWLIDSSEWNRERAGLPSVLVLRSEGPVFSSGHDLWELRRLPHDEVMDTFSLCADIMSLIRRSPAIVVCPIQGLATAAGFQLAMSTDFPIALASTKFQLPGMSIGLPCTSPATAVSRRLPPGLAYRLFASAEHITAGDLGPGVVDVVPVPEHAESTDTAARAFEERVATVVRRLAEDTAGQSQAFGKWAYWTQMGMGAANSNEREGDGYEEAAAWAGRVMALHAQSADAKEGMRAWAAKERPDWKT